MLDIHGTISNCGIFLIISKPTKDNIIFALQLPIKKIVIWNNVSGKQKFGPITKFLKRGLGIEIGPKNDNRILKQTVDILEKINSKIKNHASKLNNKKINDLIKQKEFYEVYDSLSPEKILDKNKNILNFIKYKNGNESFYPILPGEYKGKIYYKAKKMSYNKVILLVKK